MCPGIGKRPFRPIGRKGLFLLHCTVVRKQHGVPRMCSRRDGLQHTGAQGRREGCGPGTNGSTPSVLNDKDARKGCHVCPGSEGHRRTAGSAGEAPFSGGQDAYRFSNISTLSEMPAPHSSASVICRSIRISTRSPSATEKSRVRKTPLVYWEVRAISTPLA